MSAKVDVLAVFDAYSDVEGTGITQAQHDAARAAVAELIETAERVRQYVSGVARSGPSDAACANALAAALAACGAA